MWVGGKEISKNVAAGGKLCLLKEKGEEEPRGSLLRRGEFAATLPLL